MHLKDLGAKFFRMSWERRDSIVGTEEQKMGWVYVPVKTLAEAHGIEFANPRHFADRGGDVETLGHILLELEGHEAPDTISAGDQGRASWSVTGTGIEDLTLSPSIFHNRQSAEGAWHGFIVNGEVLNHDHSPYTGQRP